MTVHTLLEMENPTRGAQPGWAPQEKRNQAKPPTTNREMAPETTPTGTTTPTEAGLAPGPTPGAGMSTTYLETAALVQKPMTEMVQEEAAETGNPGDPTPEGHPTGGAETPTPGATGPRFYQNQALQILWLCCQPIHISTTQCI